MDRGSTDPGHDRPHATHRPAASTAVTAAAAGPARGEDGPAAATVAILLASFNGARYLPRQLDSIAAQDWPAWRLVVSDDGSTDATRDVVRDFAKAHPGRCIELIEGPRRGATQNFLSLIAQVRPGEWLAFCDQDDAWLPHRLSRGMQAIGGCPAGAGENGDGPRDARDGGERVAAGPAATSSRTIICDDDLRPLTPAPLFRKPPSFRNALVQACMPGNTFLANPAAAALLQQGAAAAARAGVVSHDWWAYQLLAGAGARLVRDPEPTVLYRQHRGNVMGRNDTLQARLRRVAMLGAGDFGGWVRDNVTALQGARHLLTDVNGATLDGFEAALRAPGPIAATRLARLGMYRQTRAGTAALLAAAAAGRLRPIGPRKG